MNTTKKILLIHYRAIASMLAATVFMMPAVVNAAFDQDADQIGLSQQIQILNEPSLFLSIGQPSLPTEPVMMLAMGNSNTSKVTGAINRGKSQCASVPAEYQADCLSQTFKSASRTASGMVDYVKPGKELSAANKRIDAIVSKNIDKNAPVIRKGGKRLRAVKKAAVASVNAQTKAVIAETATKLIRSAGNSTLRKTHFSRIAKAVNSTKTILRSA